MIVTNRIVIRNAKNGKRWTLSFCDFNVPTEESDWMENEINKGNGYKVYVTYEEALEAGLQEALKLI
jgi:hypothetical protein